MEETDSEQNRADGPHQGGAWSRPPRAGEGQAEEGGRLSSPGCTNCTQVLSFLRAQA